MNDSQPIPFLLDMGYLALLFLALAVSLHFLFVHKWQLSLRMWKTVDYFLLLTVAVGIVSAAGDGRQRLAFTLYEIADSRLETSAANVKDHLKFGISGAVCRKFVRSDFSPPAETFNKIQQGFDAQCSWFFEALKKIDTSPWNKRGHLQLADLGAPPPEGGDVWFIEALMKSIDRYNTDLSRRNTLEQEKRKSALQGFLEFINPLLMTIGLALAFTRITAELKLLKRK